LPGGIVIALAVYWVVDLAVVILLFAIIFKYLPDAKIQWRDVWVGALLTAIFFAIRKWALGLYLGSGSAAPAYGAASSLITLLLWVYSSSQMLLFGAEFTQFTHNMPGAVFNRTNTHLHRDEESESVSGSRRWAESRITHRFTIHGFLAYGGW
jgi:uncharacterized BrkB/YihY/UPF0761 family membrane protein